MKLLVILIMSPVVVVVVPMQAVVSAHDYILHAVLYAVNWRSMRRQLVERAKPTVVTVLGALLFACCDHVIG